MRSWRARGRPSDPVGVEFVGKQDVFERGERGDELVGLEDEADGLPRTWASLIFGKVADGGAVEVDVAGGGRVEAGEQAEQRGFAGAGGAHDGDELAAWDGEVEAFEDVDGARAVADGFAQAFDDDHRLECWLAVRVTKSRSPFCRSTAAACDSLYL